MEISENPKLLFPRISNQSKMSLRRGGGGGSFSKTHLSLSVANCDLTSLEKLDYRFIFFSKTEALSTKFLLVTKNYGLTADIL